MGEAKSDFGKMMQGRRPSTRKPQRVGRHTKLTPEISKKICDAIRAGNHLSVAAQYAGVGPETLHNWIQRGRGEHPTRSASKEFVDFAHDVSEAQAAAEVAAVLHWRSAMPKDWHAAERWLQATQPERWDPKRETNGQSAAFAGVQVNIGGPNQANGAPNTINVAEVPLESIIEANPRLLSATMHLFDEIDAIYAGEAPSNTQTSPQPDDSTPKLAIQAQSTPSASHDALYDEETGTWVIVDEDGTVI